MTLPRLKSEPRAGTLAHYFQEAGITPAPWTYELQLSFEPKPYQVLDLNHLAHELRSGLYNEAGVGKTLPMQAHGIWLVSLGNKVVYLMPPGLIEQFHLSFHSTFKGIEKYVAIEKFMGNPAERQGLIDRWEATEWPHVLLMSYTMFTGQKPKGVEKRYRHYVPYWQKGEPVTAQNFCGAVLQAKGYNQLTIDEATAVKRAESQIHQATQLFVQPELGDKSNGLILATGTPIETTVEDAYGLISLIDPTRYRSWRAFEAKHVVLNPFTPFRKVEGYTQLEDLYQALYSSGRRVLKKDVRGEMPPVTISEMQIRLSKEHMALYDKLVDEKMLELDDDKVIDATTASAIYQATQQILLNPTKFGGKFANEMVNSIDTLLDTLVGHKVILYLWYRESVDAMVEKYKALNPAVMNGEVSDKESERLKFVNDPTCRMLIANQKSGGVGVDQLQTVCSHMIFAEICPRPGVFQQALGRLDRTGQQDPVTAYLLVPRFTVAEMLRDRLSQRDDEANAVVRDKKTLLKDLRGERGMRGVLK